MNDSLETTAAQGDAAGILTAGLAAGLGTAGFFALLIVIVWQLSATRRARSLAAREEEYKRLTVTYAELLEDNTEILRRYTDGLGDTRKSVAALERMMRELDQGDPVCAACADSSDACCPHPAATTPTTASPSNTPAPGPTPARAV